jgi:hypothetical protein
VFLKFFVKRLLFEKCEMEWAGTKKALADSDQGKGTAA